MAKFFFQNTGNSHNAVENRPKCPFSAAKDTVQNTPQQGDNQNAQGTAVQQKSQDAAQYVISPYFTPCQNAGKADQCAAPEQQKCNILQRRGQLSMGENRADAAQQVKAESQGKAQKNGIQQQANLLGDCEKGFQFHHRNSFPSRESGPFRSFSPYCSSQMSPVMVMLPLSTLTSLMCRLRPLMTSSPRPVNR